MSITLGAWLATTSGIVTGWIAPFILQRSPSRGAVILSAALGALIAALAYGAFLAAGALISLLLFTGAPDPGPALLCAVIGCAAYLLLRWLQRALGPHRLPAKPRDGAGDRGFERLLDARPAGGRAKMWLAGVGLPLLPVIYGLQCLLTRKGELGTLLWPVPIEGGPAIALGLGWIGVGAFLHFHFFFGLHPRLEAHSRSGKLAALVPLFAGFLVAGVWSVLSKAM